MRHPLRLAQLASMLLVTACAGLERDAMTGFDTERGADGRTHFRYWVDVLNPAGSAVDPAEERRRIDWLEQILGEEGLCRNGYEIVSRRPITKTRPGTPATNEGYLRSERHERRIFYLGRCL